MIIFLKKTFQKKKRVKQGNNTELNGNNFTTIFLHVYFVSSESASNF